MRWLFWRSYLPVILWTLFIIVMCTIRLPAAVNSVGWFEGFDKLTHLGFFFVETVLCIYAAIGYGRRPGLRWWKLLLIILVNFALGIGIELVQGYFFTYRSADKWDFFCDAIGALMALFAYCAIRAATVMGVSRGRLN